MPSYDVPVEQFVCSTDWTAGSPRLDRRHPCLQRRGFRGVKRLRPRVAGPFSTGPQASPPATPRFRRRQTIMPYSRWAFFDWTAGIPACNAAVSAASNDYVLESLGLFRTSCSGRQGCLSSSRYRTYIGFEIIHGILSNGGPRSSR